MSAESPGQKQGFKSKFSNALRPKKSRQVLRKGSRSTTEVPLPPGPDLNKPLPDPAPLQAHRLKYKQMHSQVDTQLGERRDYTTMIHSLGLLDPMDNSGPVEEDNENREPGEGDIAKLPRRLWAYIAWFLSPADAASLSLASITLYRRLGFNYFMVLDHPANYDYKMDFLAGIDRDLPRHLLCFPCGRYHRRTQEGTERLKPSHVINPLFNCPNAQNMLNPPPRHRITHGRTLPFSFVQLAMRAHRFGPHYGISVDSLARRWQRDDWSHSSRYLVHDGRLLMRVTSQTFAPAGLPPSSQRLLLHSREDYWPFFSACAHWRDGELMPACKCALNHIPKARDNGGLQAVEHKVKDRWAGRQHDPNALTTLCGFCRPMRRCPECPSEYLIEVKLTEDRSDPRNLQFRQAIVVTRWTDLGDGTTPNTIEWGAVNGQRDDYDSFQHYEKRAIASIFEAAFTADALPGQRIISMNPKQKKQGEKGHDWY
ncbi:hypothetical protein NUU61_007989 [Penicillium alfredii]|uniref:Uncharacterized protein n=1 Tax=Penicillium alfredii TaxID=1506179 RepID=A0A9W9ERJ5_9EURO|nr:uncharacterized protein NUU61_007989 [Penicillium alfredii]KAJ5086682.1 hypothetical protein NUU61_007989 [Penicillium alfredii]